MGGYKRIDHARRRPHTTGACKRCGKPARGNLCARCACKVLSAEMKYQNAHIHKGI